MPKCNKKLKAVTFRKGIKIEILLYKSRRKLLFEVFGRYNMWLQMEKVIKICSVPKMVD